MARENHILLDDDEKELLDETRKELFGTSEIPYGATIEALCEQAEN